jgi:diguanylate cyclase (GGDEF)-like protein/PAS domain S-box-containing protein
MTKFLDFIKQLSFWKFITLFVILAILISEALIIAQSYLLHGELRSDLLIVGFFTPAIDALVVFFIVGLVLAQLKEKEKLLSVSETRLQETQQYAQIGSWELLADQQTAIWSAQMYEIFGLSPNTAPGIDALQTIMDENDYATYLESIERSFSTGDEHHLEYRVTRNSDNEERWIECRGKLFHDQKTRSHKMSGYVRDITQQKRSEQVLRVLAEFGEGNNENLFQLMVKELATSQGMRYAFIALIDPKNSNIANTIAYWADGQIAKNFSYNLTGTPCYNVSKNDACFYPMNIQQLFPDDHFLVDMDAQSYIGEPLIDSQGNTLGILALMDDREMKESAHTHNLLKSLSTRASIELQRLAAHKKLQLSDRVFNTTQEGIMITDADSHIIDVNPAFCEITGYHREEMIGANPRILNSGRQSPELYESMWQTINHTGHWHGEVWNRKKNGEIYAELLTVSALKNDQGEVTNYVGIFTDITQSKKQQEELQLMAHFDVLTGLPNRTLFVDRFNQAVAHSHRSQTLLAICFLDLDDFKPVNDNYGHDVGDDLLVEVAQRIRDHIREEDTVSRLGGDEFAILLSDVTTPSQCELTLQRIHHALAQPFHIDGLSHKISASSGVTFYPQDDGDIDTLLRHADQAMYQAKLQGKQHYQCFNPNDDRLAKEKHQLLENIQLALENNEFALYYQPKVNMSSGHVYGMEALIRWLHPEQGLIPPIKFLPAIEGTDLEIKLGDWVVYEAFKQLNTWLEQGVELEVSVNIASHHLLSNDFFNGLEQTLSSFPKVNSEYLQLEILESSALSDLTQISRLLKRCQKELGVKIALDDFGTGYSSLAHLRSLTANTIKIDQSFVRDMLDDPSDSAIINGIIGLAKSFERDIIAEGVETTEHGLALIVMGCEKAQGYGIAKPMPEDKVTNWLDSYQPNEDWLHCANNIRSLKDTKITLLKLISRHWIDRFIANVNMSPNNIEHWPILNNSKHCPAGAWISRAKQSDLFTVESIATLEKAHDIMHEIAQDIHQQYNDGDIESARKKLPALQLAYNDMNNAIDQCA